MVKEPVIVVFMLEWQNLVVDKLIQPADVSLEVVRQVEIHLARCFRDMLRSDFSLIREESGDQMDIRLRWTTCHIEVYP